MRAHVIHLRDRSLLRLLSLPPHVLRRLSGGTIEREGRTLDAQAQMLCLLARMFAPHAADMKPEEARRHYEESGPTIGGPARAMRGMRDFDLGTGVRARWYLPENAERALVIYFHGGGFVSGSILSHDRTVRLLADETRVPFLSIEYRLAPEHRFPCAVDDAMRAYLWARENAKMLHADADRIALMGDSAGGNLSIVVARMARDEDLPPPKLVVPIYPAVDFTKSMRSHTTYGEGFFLDRRSIDYYLGTYAADPLDPRASPLLANDHGGLPRTIVITAGFDPLVDEGDAIAKKMKDAGAHVHHVRHDSLIHGFVNMAGAVDAARSALLSLAHDVSSILRA